ncbi:MAG: hypothetical protein ABFD69_11400 [Candidatus Sumerlaeia bacterium]
MAKKNSRIRAKSQNRKTANWNYFWRGADEKGNVQLEWENPIKHEIARNQARGEGWSE